MQADPHLSRAEWESLRKVGTNLFHAPISAEHAKKLLALKLIYNLLGSYRITTPGRAMLKCSATETNLDYASKAKSLVSARAPGERRNFRWDWMIWSVVVAAAVLYSWVFGLLPI